MCATQSLFVEVDLQISLHKIQKNKIRQNNVEKEIKIKGHYWISSMTVNLQQSRKWGIGIKIDI
jgi:urease beta subunit